jgi:ABC-2 type transport system permease protein
MQESSSFRGFIWVQLVRQNLSYLWIVFAVLLGAEGPFSHRTSAIFTLSLPVSRREVFTVRAATDLAELGVLAFIPLLLIPLAAPVVGYTYALADALVYGMQIFAGGAVFYCLALWLATAFGDRWRPMVITLAAAVAGNLCANFIPVLAPFSPATVMIGESYFRTGMPAWAGMCLWLGVSAAVLYAAVRSIESRDF